LICDRDKHGHARSVEMIPDTTARCIDLGERTLPAEGHKTKQAPAV